MKNEEDINNILLSNLKELLESNNGRFSNYQELAPCVLDKIGKYISKTYSQNQIPLDRVRYNWLIKQIKPNRMSVIEIGSNLGYFILRLASEFNASVKAYEPVFEYSKATSLMAELCDLAKNISCISDGLLKEDLFKLSKSDLIINLNVLHHAGVEYDSESLKNAGGWQNYFLEYLSILSQKGQRLFLQTGNISSEKRLFSMEDAVPYINSLLKRSGWNTKAVGIIEDFDKLSYSTYSSSELDRVPNTLCTRNKDTGLVDYFRNNKLCVSFPTGLAARPLWYCESNK